MSMFNAYKTQFDELTAKGFKPKLNIMDNQAKHHIKKYLTKKDCKLQVFEPYNHPVNATEQAIQTFKAAFIAALATTDSKFPLKLWDRLTLQVQDTLNMLRASCIDPTVSAYMILTGAYNWNRYPLAPLGCKAVVYKDCNTRGSWASQGVDAFYLGPAQDHYQCDHYYIPETRAHRISGSTELFLQHCQVLALTPHQHLRALTDELTRHTAEANTTPKGRHLLKLLSTRIHDLLTVDKAGQWDAHEAEQKVIDDTPIIMIPCLTKAKPIMKSRNPTSKRMLKITPRLHQQVTRNNTPGVTPTPHIIEQIPAIVPANPKQPTRKQQRRGAKARHTALTSGARQRIVTQQAINVLTIRKQTIFSTAFTPCALIKHAKMLLHF